eukprot:550412_1
MLQYLLFAAVMIAPFRNMVLGCDIRCGINWPDANTKCGDCCVRVFSQLCFTMFCCVNDGACTITGEHCYADLNADVCGTSPIGGGCSSNIRCGTNWPNANSKCGDCCANDGDCTITGERCYAHLNADVCGDTVPPSTGNLKVISGCGSGKRVSLTFDDGPTEQNQATLEIINKLNAYGIKATFYVSTASSGDGAAGSAARCELISQIAASGNEIQSHSWSHSDFATLTNDQIISELNKVADFIIDCGGKHPTTFRPPYGSLTKQQAEFIVAQGYIVSLWNLDSNDWKTPNNLAAILNNIDLNKFNGDSINILMHDRSIYRVIGDIIEVF